MDKNPGTKSFEIKVIGRCGGDEKTNDRTEPTKSNAKRNILYEIGKKISKH